VRRRQVTVLEDVLLDGHTIQGQGEGSSNTGVLPVFVAVALVEGHVREPQGGIGRGVGHSERAVVGLDHRELVGGDRHLRADPVALTAAVHVDVQGVVPRGPRDRLLEVDRPRAPVVRIGLQGDVVGDLRLGHHEWARAHEVIGLTPRLAVRLHGCLVHREEDGHGHVDFQDTRGRTERHHEGLVVRGHTTDKSDLVEQHGIGRL